MVSMLIVLSIFVAVAIGYKRNINIGLIAIAFSYIFGTAVLGMKTSAIIALWPTNLFFFIMMASFFYGIAVTNGTLAAVSEHIIYRFRNRPYLIPIMLWLICFAIAGLGAGGTTVFAFMPAIILGMCDRIKLNKTVAAVCIVGGGVAGSYTPISMCWVSVEAYMTQAGWTAAESAAMIPRVAFNNILAQVLIFALVYVITRAWKVESPVYEEKPAALSKKQKQTLAVIGLGLAVAMVFPLLCTIFPNIPVLATIKGYIEPSLLFAVLLVISLLLNLGDQKKALGFVPWGTIILVCGTGMLVSVAKSAGAIDFIASWVGEGMSPVVAKTILALCAGFMSLFSSTVGVVAPTLIPFIPSISAATGVAPTALISAIMVGGHFAGVSPFSTGGAMTMAGETDEKKKNTLFISLMVLAFGSMLFASLLTLVGVIA